MGITSIEWADNSWPIVNGCTEHSKGCLHCYAKLLAATRLKHLPRYAGLASMRNGRPHWSGEFRFAEDLLTAPLHWRKPRKIFVADMGDLFGEGVPDEVLDRIFGVMWACLENKRGEPWHTFQVVTKRAARQLEYLTGPNLPSRWAAAAFAVAGREAAARTERLAHAPHPRIWHLASVEDQAAAEEQIPPLLLTPAAIRGISAEPLLAVGRLDLTMMSNSPDPSTEGFPGAFNALTGWWWPAVGDVDEEEAGAVQVSPPLDWVIVGPESGHRARPGDIAAVRNLVRDCDDASVACFVKQLGRRPFNSAEPWGHFVSHAHWVNKAASWTGHMAPPPILVDAANRVITNGGGMRRAEESGAFPIRICKPLRLRSRKGSDMAEWDEDLRVRQFPKAAA